MLQYFTVFVSLGKWVYVKEIKQKWYLMGMKGSQWDEIGLQYWHGGQHPPMWNLRVRNSKQKPLTSPLIILKAKFFMP